MKSRKNGNAFSVLYQHQDANISERAIRQSVTMFQRLYAGSFTTIEPLQDGFIVSGAKKKALVALPRTFRRLDRSQVGREQEVRNRATILKVDALKQLVQAAMEEDISGQVSSLEAQLGLRPACRVDDNVHDPLASTAPDGQRWHVGDPESAYFVRLGRPDLAYA